MSLRTFPFLALVFFLLVSAIFLISHGWSVVCLFE